MKGKNVKSRLVGMPKRFYNALEFEELKIGDKFIGLPLPGDNRGHGGLRNAHHVFKKIAFRVNNFSGPPENALRLMDRSLSQFPEGMPVIKIED